MKNGAIPVFTILMLAFTFLAGSIVSFESHSQDAEGASCATVRYLMDREITPYDLAIGGGFVQNDTLHRAAFEADQYADTWLLSVRPRRNAGGFIVDDTLTIHFDAADENLNLEFALFYGMEMLQPGPARSGYRPVNADDTHTFTVNRDGAYTLVIRRTRAESQASGSYAFMAMFSEGDPITPRTIRDETLRRLAAAQPEMTEDGHIRVPLDIAQLRLHTGALTGIATRDTTGVQLFFTPTETNFSLMTNAWADTVSLLGGDLAAHGTTEDGPRIYYFKDYGYRTNVTSSDFVSIVDSEGVSVNLSWDALKGVWIDDNCAGFKLKNDTTFIADIEFGSRSVNFSGTESAFNIGAFSPDRSGSNVQHTFNIDWRGVVPGSEATLIDGVLNLQMLGGRDLTLESRQIDMRTLDDAGVADDEVFPIAVTLGDRGASIALDWSNLQRFALIEDTIALHFIDELRARNITQRSSENLELFEAIDDVIRISYQDEEGVPGAEHLLLPNSESYIEIVTPAGLPAFSPAALPDQTGYAPRGLNNLGGECYPINTMQPQANCPPNGYPNPANGNVWYGVTDLLAAGGLIDIALTRSYNSMDYLTDGPFGKGWSTAFRLDYNVPFTPQTNSRVVNPNVIDAYPVGLDLTWAPRGLVTVIMPSGSRHVFQSQSNEFTEGVLRAITMPGWTLSHEDVRAEHWILRQDDGLEYHFDRAGRLRAYGYPQQDRLIKISYRGTYLNGPGDVDSDFPVVIIDDQHLRRMELYYDDDHIVRAVLRDMTQVDNPLQLDLSRCLPEENCYETTYAYDADHLVAVQYADGSTATYRYDAVGHMSGHDDPKAPIADRMIYAYGADGSLTILVGDDNAVWHRLDAPVIAADGLTLTREVTGPHGAARTFTYDLSPTGLKTAGTTFTLSAETSPLAGTTEFSNLPFTFTWQDGILQSVNERLLRSGNERAGRVSDQFVYAPSGYHPNRIHVGYPEWRATYGTFTGLSGETLTLPLTVTYPDDSMERFAYDENGRLIQMINRYSGQFAYVWNEQNRLARIIDQTADTVTAYTYNALGLVETVASGRTDDPFEQYHTVRYNYDGLGRLIAVESADLSGSNLPPRLSVEYVVDTEAHTTLIAVTEVTVSITTSVFNSSGKLIEERIEAPQTSLTPAYLQRTAYTYDTFRQLQSEIRYLLETGENGELIETPIVTQFSTTSVPTLADGTRINGYRVTRTDPIGRTEHYTYDALDRIRQVEDINGFVYRYDYAIDGLGLNVTEQLIVGGQVITTTNYLFEARWQLRGVLRQTSGVAGQLQEWEINFDQLSTRLTQLVFGRWQQNWPAYVGRPTTVNLSRDSLMRDVTGVNPPSPAVQAAYDHLGRPLQVTYEINDDVLPASTRTYQLRYCPLPFNAVRVIYAFPTEGGPAPLECDSTDVVRSVTYDAHGRLSQVTDTHGTRQYTYRAIFGGWNVAVAMDGNLSWSLRYDSLGRVVHWQDENGIIRDYTYDTLGRMTSVTTTLPDGTPQPEASFTYTYNEIGLVTSALDQLGRGRGTRYSYDDRGNLTVAQDVRTANATIYGYNANGLLSTVISPLGSTTTFLYEDPQNPTRLTAITDPTGNALTFDWDEPRNRLTFTDARGNAVRYTFDRYGALWRVEELDFSGNLVRQHDLRYDAGGSLTGWRQAQPRDLERNPGLHLQIESDPETLAVRPGSGDMNWARTFELNGLQQVTSITDIDSEAESLQFYYDAVGRLIAMEAPERSWTLDYASGLPHLTYNDAFGHVHELNFDALNRLLSANVGSAETSLSYNTASIADLVLTMTSDLGQQAITYATGDDATRPTAVIVRTPGQRRTYLYSDEGQLAEVTHEACVVSLPPTVEMDEAEATPEATPEATEVPEVTANALPDNCISDDDSTIWRVTQRMAYDPLGRPVRYVDEEQNIETFSYDDSGNLVSYQNANGTTFNYVYDASNRLVHITSATGLRLLLDYDDLDRVTGVCRARAENANTYTACASDPSAVLATYRYDSIGRLSLSRPGAETDLPSVVNVYAPEGGGLLTGWDVQGATDDTGVRFDRDNTLNRLNAVTVDDTTTTLNFAGTDRIAAMQNSGAENQTYTYDDYGRLQSVTIAGRTFEYAYQPEGGFTVSDISSDAALTFGLDNSGFLSTIDVPGVEDNEAAIIYQPSVDGRVLISRIPYEPMTSGERSRVEIQLDPHGATRNVAYVQQDLFIDFVIDPIGQPQRQSINGADAYFDESAEGYVIVFGYDNDDRPLTMRVSDRETGSLLFLLNYTYDGVGRRVTETRQFGDDTQYTIVYRYDGDRPISREIVITSDGVGDFEPVPSTNGGPLLALGALLIWLLRTPTRRRSIVALTIAVAILVLMLSMTGAQINPDAIMHTYEYDDAGNVTAIVVTNDPNDPEAVGTVCASYRYDSANRLLSATLGQGAIEREYQYDLYNRLVAVDERILLYHGQTDHLLASFEADGPVRFYGQTGPNAPFAVGENNIAQWLLINGRGLILGEANQRQPLWLFDPLGGYLSLSMHARSDSCLLAELPSTLRELNVVPMIEPGTVWDPAANLFFSDGRAYAPELGTYLQRDPLGPDVYGNLYAYPTRTTMPPRRMRNPAYVSGLFRLRQAMDTLTVTEQLRADVIAARHQPVPHLYQLEPLVDYTQAVTGDNRAQQRTQLDLPQWLATNYNLHSAYIDPEGALRLPRDNAPGSGGPAGVAFIETDVHFSPFDHWLPQLPTPMQHLSRLVALTKPRTTALTVYLPHQWMPDTVRLEDTFIDPEPVLSLDQTPRAVMQHLPQSLADPVASSMALDAVLALSTLPRRDGTSWIEAGVEDHLPSLPQLPPSTREEWLSLWFIEDTLGTMTLLEPRWPDLPVSTPPLFNLGRNDNYWEPVR